MDIDEILKQLGCDTSEARSFTALLGKLEGSTASEISKMLKIPRTTVYSQIDSLAKKGLIKKGVNQRGSIFFAENPEVILHLFDKKIDSMAVAREQLKDILDSKKVIIEVPSPKFFAYQNPKAAEQILWDMLLTDPKETYSFWPMKEIVKVISKETFIEFHKERIRRNIHLKVLWPQKQSIKLSDYPYVGPADSKKSLREIRVLPGKINQVAAYVVYGTRVAFISSEKENFGFVIDSEELSKTIKSHFDYLWQLSRPYKEG